MKKILIFGLKEPVGGVEKIITSYVEHFPEGEIVCDYVFFGDLFSLEERIRQKGGTVFYLPNRIRKRKAYFEKLNRIFDERQYDAVWANFSGLTNIDVLKLGKRYGVPVRVAHSHTAMLYWSGWYMQYAVRLFHTLHKRKIDRYATDFWACSQKSGEFMYPKKVQDRIRIVTNAVDTAQFFADAAQRKQLRQSQGLKNALVVGHIARMSAEKNQGFLLEVFAAVRKRNENARLLFVGDGELREMLTEKANLLGIADAVIFAGFQTDIAAYYRVSDVFVLPSVSEGLPLTVVEAQACGVPCVVSDAVPKVADVSGCVRFLGLEQSIETWRDAILEAGGQTIADPLSAVKNAGYDIQTEAEKICRFFTENGQK